MRTAELKRAAEAALALLGAEPGIREAEVFAAVNRSLVTRLNYTSHIPCNGVEEPKSTEMSGLGLQVDSSPSRPPLIGSLRAERLRRGRRRRAPRQGTESPSAIRSSALLPRPNARRGGLRLPR